MRRLHSPVLPAALALLFPCVAAPDVAAAEADSFQELVRPFLQKHCSACHGAETQQAGVRFDGLGGYAVEQQTLWTLVHEKLRTGEMPPVDAAQPPAGQTKRILSWIEQQAAVARRERGGGTRRLNRRELGAALRDLTGLDVDYAAALPGDGKVAGFDTGAEALQDAADSVARLMEVTRRAVEGIRFLEPERGPRFFADLRDVKDARKALDSWEEQGADVKTRGHGRPGMGLLIEPKWLGERGAQEIYVPAPEKRRGVLRLRLVVAAKKFSDEVPPPHLEVKVGGKTLEYHEVTGTVETPDQLVYEVQLNDLAIGTRGVEIELCNRVELPYAVKGFENEDRTKPDDGVPPGLFRPNYRKMKLPPEEEPVAFVVLQEIEVQPDYVSAWPPAEWPVDVGTIGDDTQTADRLLDLWMERAWRRPVDDDERERFLSLYTDLRDEGLSFDTALRAAFQSVLLSGPFRYLGSPSDPDETLAQHAIASRLSFMLLGTPPDGELRRLAAEGRLREPDVLNAQVERLLDDTRSAGFFRPFVTQWLEMDQPITLVMDHFGQQDFRFGRYLKESMRRETITYVARLFRENRPARELLDSDWTMMNDSLAVHYGYEGIEGGELRKVKLRKDDPRGGGILSHAGIQSMLCWMGENWVIYRGAWALRHILDDPPPPPPLEVPELNPSAGKNRGKTFKELLRQHQADERCAVCHRKMDPLGFAFQNFDLSGRWRDVEYERYDRNELDGKIAWRGVGESRPVDATGKLPRGEEFESYDEFKQLLVENYTRDVVRGLLKNFVIYGTGRRPDVHDMAVVREILDEQSGKDFPLRDVLQALVRSRVFLE